MAALVYIVPILCCLVLRLGLGYTGDWTAYLWVFLAGEGTVGAIHWILLKTQCLKTEYLGSMVTGIYYEEPWTELVEEQETRTDSRGRSYTVTRIRKRHHPESFYFVTSRNSSVSCGPEFFAQVRSIWSLPRREDCWTGRRIRGGARYGHHYSFSDFDESGRNNPDNWVPVTEPHLYTNKVVHSNSIFKYEKISSERAGGLGLYDYPEIAGYDASCILSHDIPVEPATDSLFRKFNAVYAPEVQMRLYILLFNASQGIGISELQRAYWQGGNKNEFVVCIGMSSDGKVKWARTFSWADEQTVEVEASRWLMDHPSLVWEEFHAWLVEHTAGWKRKEFKDFKYIRISLPAWKIALMFVLAVLESVLAIYWTVG